MSFLALLLTHLAFAVLAVRPGVSPSRRALAGAASLLVPVAGVILAMLIRRVRGGGGEAAPEPVVAPGRTLTAADVKRLGDVSPVLDRLMSNDPSDRLAALVSLSTAGDAEAVGILRWAIEHGSSEVVLDAALTLEELDLRRERALEQATARMVEAATADNALAVADAAADGVLSGIVDPVAVPALAEQARTAYLYARAQRPELAGEIEDRMARLELAAGRPHEALELVAQRVAAEPTLGAAPALVALRDAAAFAARRFELVSAAVAAPPALADHPAFARMAASLDRARAVGRGRTSSRGARRTFERAAMAVKAATGVWQLDDAMAR